MPNRPRYPHVVSVPLRKVDLVRLDLLAKRRDIPRTAIIREAIRDYLARDLVDLVPIPLTDAEKQAIVELMRSLRDNPPPPLPPFPASEPGHPTDA